MQRRRGVRAALAAVARVGAFATLGALAFGCASVEQAGETVAFSLNPFASTPIVVTSSERHGPYLFVGVHSRQLQERFITPASEACARVLAPEAAATYQRRHNFGRFTAAGEGEPCDAVGTLSLADRRRPGERRPTDSVVPRTVARFSVAHRDDRYILLRGRFALAARVGVPSSGDIVAVLPDDEPCREVASRREATLEFRVSGRDPFRLLAGGPGCVVAGFAMPVDGLAAAGSEGTEGADPR